MPEGQLGGSGVVISGVKSPLIWVITIVILLLAILITTHEPPRRNKSATALQMDGAGWFPGSELRLGGFPKPRVGGGGGREGGGILLDLSDSADVRQRGPEDSEV